MSVLRRLSDATTAQNSALLALNNGHAEETSFLTPERWDALLGQAFYAAFVADARGFVIALEQSADYDSVNYRWFAERFDRFSYVDRIVVSADSRAQGIARRLYDALFDVARAAGHTRVCCEVNRVPPNPGSDAFHAKLGFVELETLKLGGSGKTVRYLCREL